MRLIKSFGLILLSLAGVAASAQTFEVDGINYNVLSEAEGTVEVANGNYSGDVVIPAEVTYDGSTYSVTTIGNGAFENCSSLTSVEMPSVKMIGDYAFFLCSSLISVSMPAVITIGDYAFSNCGALTSVFMPVVTTIGGYAFNYCWDLTSVSMPEVTTIGDWAFYDCKTLTLVSMPSVTTIGDYTFHSCEALRSVDMPSVTTIGDYAFIWCGVLTSVEMPSVITIGDMVFYTCNALTYVSIPASCSSIGSNPFIECNDLKEIVVDERNPNYSSADGVLYDKDKTTIISWPTAKGNVDILPSVTTIGDRAFFESRVLTSVSMPSVKTIDDYAFNSCYALTSAYMPSVTTIGDEAFRFCPALTSVDIPASVTTIGKYVFSGCSSLTSVYCHWEDPLECDPRFENTVLETATLYVPTGTVDAYRSVSPWSGFINIVERDYSGIADATAPEVVIKVIDGAISVEGGDGTASAPVVEVYSAGGQCVYRGTDSSIGGLGHGIYVVKVGGTVQKVAL